MLSFYTLTRFYSATYVTREEHRHTLHKLGNIWGLLAHEM